MKCVGIPRPIVNEFYFFFGLRWVDSLSLNSLKSYVFFYMTFVTEFGNFWKERILKEYIILNEVNEVKFIDGKQLLINGLVALV